MKFGGTSVGAADPLDNAVQVIRERAAVSRPVVVVSAAAGVTDHLVRAARETRGDRATAEVWVRDVKRRYRSLATEALDEPLLSRYDAVLGVELSELRRGLQALAGPDAAAARAAVLAAGERLMAPLVVAALEGVGCPARVHDAASLIRTDGPSVDATVDPEATRQQVQDWFQACVADDPDGTVPVVTGFIGGTADGTTTTLGRGGSDLSAAVLARALDADRLERWTDVDGLYTRDPNEYDDARRLEELDFPQARTWTQAGRLGMHPSTLEPLASANIPVHVRCTHRPEAPGTRITPAAVPTQ
jgi:aspartate kinase